MSEKKTPNKLLFNKAVPALLASVLLAWVILWILHFGVTLINDEYAAIDYFYRVVRKGHFFPTPDKLHKPLSVLMGSVAWLFESPLAFEVATALFAALFVVMFYLVLKREAGPIIATVAGAALVFHPDLMYYSATGSTVLPFAGLSFLGLYAALRRHESPRMLWLFAGSFLAAGLFRPESWLFAGPALAWWWPGLKDRKGLVRLFIALAVIGLGPVLWFGKDWLINDNLLHGLAVATRDKAVGTGAPLSAGHVLHLFSIRIPNRISVPVTLAGALGMAVFIRRQGWRGFLHPLVVFPLLVAAYVWLIVYMGVYPVQRYWFYDAMFAYFFTAWLAREASLKVKIGGYQVVPPVLFLCALFPALGYVLARPGSSPPDLRWLLAFGGFAAVAVAALLVWGGRSKSRFKDVVLLGFIVLMVLSYPVFIFGLHGRESEELRLEARKQSEMKEAAAYLKKRFTREDEVRVLVPSRRNEQLNWLFRERERPEVITFREAFYLDWTCREPAESPTDFTPKIKEFCRKWLRQGYDFLVLQPDWIVYIPDDYQFWGPTEKFQWMETQDRAVIRGIRIELKISTGLVRVFQVHYPETAPPREPVPRIP
ncbi:MAG: hypothetical protein R6V10_02780 [bacterium]